jgi:hypothetical protein
MLHKDAYGVTYASIGVAADYPGHILVTISSPSIDSAVQYLFDPENPVVDLGARSVDPGMLPDSVKQWNAHLNDDGFLIVDGREAESMP